MIHFHAIDGINVVLLPVPQNLAHYPGVKNDVKYVIIFHCVLQGENLEVINF